jgi:drug/metabolite transporter (DMT)-like permease
VKRRPRPAGERGIFYARRLTRASTAGYFEMMQTLAAVCITWGVFHASLHPHQVIAAVVLIAAVAMVHHVQQQIEHRNLERTRR